MLVEMDTSFLRSLLRDFVEDGRAHGRSDEDIEQHLRNRMRDHGVANQDKLVRLAFQEDQPSLPNERRVHLLRYGVALCGAGVPGAWPSSHRWLDAEEYPENVNSDSFCNGCTGEWENEH